jgi:hypothetical protein
LLRFYFSAFTTTHSIADPVLAILAKRVYPYKYGVLHVKVRGWLDFGNTRSAAALPAHHACS